jgi:two-component system, OmpR family, phosphate regulon response regulator PhoB
MSEILIVEDDPSIAELLWLHAQEAGHQPKVAFTGKKAIELIGERLPAAVILDWTLPDMTGLSLLSSLRLTKRTKDLAVIVLGEGRREADIFKALDAGADFYLLKPFSTKELFARVQVMLRARPVVNVQDVLSAPGIRVSLTSHRVFVRRQNQEVAVELSPTGFKILRLFLTHPGEIFSREALVKEVWAEQPDTRERAVDIHIKYLRDALKPYDTMIETIRRRGYRFTNSDSLSLAESVPGVDQADAVSKFDSIPGELPVRV